MSVNHQKGIWGSGFILAFVVVLILPLLCKIMLSDISSDKVIARKHFYQSILSRDNFDDDRVQLTIAMSHEYIMFTDQWYGVQSSLSNLDQIDCRLFAFGILGNRFIIYCRHLRQIYEVCIETREHWGYQGKVLLGVITITCFPNRLYL